jgi:hypothetical protein
MSMFSSGFNGWKNINTQYLFNSAIIIGLSVFLLSCVKDPDKIGRDLLPASDNISVKVDTSTKVGSYTISGKRVFTSDNSSNSQLYALGSQKDSIFGFTNASILTRFHPSLLISADSVRTLDSLVLYLVSANKFGDTLGNLTVRVYELNKEMSADSNYYSDINPSDFCDFSTELAHTTFTPHDSIIRIDITDSEFRNKFETLPDTVFKDLDMFYENFYGFYITVDQVPEKGGFSYLNLSSYDTRLTMYYNGANYNDTISNGYEMSFTSIAAKANVFSHIYDGFPILPHINVPESKDSLIFIEGLAGTSGRISLPNLEVWRSKNLITINKAELIIPVDTSMDPSIMENDFPPKLLLFSLGNNDDYNFLYDYRVDQSGSYFDGSYDVTRKAYIFNIALHLQSYVSGIIEKSDLILVSRQSNSSANRVILKGATSATPIKLKVIYTELF